MRMSIAILAAAAVMATGCQRGATVQAGGDVAPERAPIPTTAAGLPAGATMTVSLDQELGTRQSREGDRFSATVTHAIVAQNGETVIPAGARVHGRVIAVQSSSRVGEQAFISLDFDSLTFNGRRHELAARVQETRLEERGAGRDETLQSAGVGAAAGAVLGAVLSGGSLRGILTGAAAGAAAGTVISLGTGDVEGVLPQGTQLRLETTQQISLR
jgi:hypothetical protein